MYIVFLVRQMIKLCIGSGGLRRVPYLVTGQKRSWPTLVFSELFGVKQKKLLPHLHAGMHNNGRKTQAHLIQSHNKSRKTHCTCCYYVVLQ